MLKIQYISILRKIVPFQIRHFIWEIIPKVDILNTYKLELDTVIKDLPIIDSIFLIREVGMNDWEKLKEAHMDRGKKAFKRKVPPRLLDNAWVGLAVFDNTNGKIAYIAWVVIDSIDYFKEFNIDMQSYQFLLKDGYCVSDYRHRGIHTRMELERINYCIEHGAKEVFIQIHETNEKGKQSVEMNGYKLIQQDRVLIIPAFNIFREFKSAIKRPFKRIVI